jgi:hypothetical protein
LDFFIVLFIFRIFTILCTIILKIQSVMRSIAIIIIIALVPTCYKSCKAPDQKGSGAYRIVKQDQGWVLLKEGNPFYVKGAVANDHMDKIKAFGGNSVRIWHHFRQGMDEAQKYGLSVMVSLPVRPERNGMNWEDTAMVERNIREVMSVVEEFKDHPALMLWALGNELDWIPPGIPYNPVLWDWIELMAQEIKEIDPLHPVMTVIGDSDFDKKTGEIATQCPSLDLVGVNLYGDFSDKAEILQRNWKKPYVVTEWGPHGHWQRPYTKWKAPLEESSTEKAATYRHSYTQVILKDTIYCLGSYVFLWGQKQEITHTWYGMFSEDGLESESVNVMQELWSGKPPPNRAPRVKELLINGKPRQADLYLEGGKMYAANLRAEDAEDELTYHWEIREEVNPAPYAGIGELPAEPIEGLIEETAGESIQFKAPDKEGAYRLFGYVYDGQGHWAYANFPFYCY